MCGGIGRLPTGFPQCKRGDNGWLAVVVKPGIDRVHLTFSLFWRFFPNDGRSMWPTVKEETAGLGVHNLVKLKQASLFHQLHVDSGIGRLIVAVQLPGITRITKSAAAIGIGGSLGTDYLFHQAYSVSNGFALAFRISRLGIKHINDLLPFL